MWCPKTYTNSTVHIDENLIEEPINELFNIECSQSNYVRKYLFVSNHFKIYKFKKIKIQ